MDTIAIIIVHFNNETDTKDCLKSLRELKTKDFNYQVIIVDNGSRKAFSLARNLGGSNISVIRSEANLGFTGGNNLGVTYAREKFDPDYFLLLNNDTTVDPDFLYHLHQRAERNEKVGLICSKIYFSKGSEYHSRDYAKKHLGNVIWYGGGSLDWPNLVAYHRGVDEVDRNHFDHQEESDFATGCSLLIPREIIETVGLFDKHYFLYMEDVDYSVRAQQAGFGIYFEPQSKVWHKNASSSGGAGSALSQYYQTRNRLFFALKHAYWRYKITAVRLALQMLTHGNKYERQAVIDLCLRRMGKQPIM